jgi:mRNA interferase RelE/StbE
VAWRIEYLRSARKSVEKLDPKLQMRIREYLYDRVAALDDVRQLGKPLNGPLKSLWSYRVGDHRIICDIQDAKLVILVVAFGSRRDVYR